MAFFFKKKTEAEDASMINNIYLIDTENVRSVWTSLLDQLTDQDKVYVFYTRNSGNISYEQITGILQYGNHVELVECFTGRNGLDFQLVTYLGYLICENATANYCIVSDDGGFDAAVKFWKKRGKKITRKTANEVTGKEKRNPFNAMRKSKDKDVEATKTKNVAQNEANANARKSGNSAAKVDESASSASSLVAQMMQENRSVLAEENRMAGIAEDPFEGLTAKKQGQKKNTPKQQKVEKKTEKSASKEQPKPKQVPKKKNSNPVATDVPKTEAQAKEQKEAQKEEKQKLQKQQPQKQPKQQQQKEQAKKEQPSKQQQSKSNQPTAAPKLSSADITMILPDESPERVEAIYQILVKAGGPQNLAGIHDGIEKLYRDDHAKVVYQAIKPHVKALYRGSQGRN